MGVLAVVTTIVIHDTPYGVERAYNALRLALTLTTERFREKVRVFLLGDAVYCAVKGQKPPEGYYNVEEMLRKLLERGCEVRACGSCLRLRGLQTQQLVEGVKPGTMIELSKWVLESDRVLIF